MIFKPIKVLQYRKILFEYNCVSLPKLKTISLIHTR